MIDLLGLSEEKATEILSAQGLPWMTEVTAPPRKPLDDGYFRVVKQELIGGIYRLTLCKVPDHFR
ncbi:MAG: hypothetical protein WC977_04020 [Anaerovoracaceae bacterium]